MAQRRDLFTFLELVKSEHDQLERVAAAEAIKTTTDYTIRKFDGKVELNTESGEPWLVEKSEDRVGLALSGGGIRSATFCLGLLQSLSRQGVLGLVDYMSTVSGGGYVGGFWTAWKQRCKDKEIFPGEAEPVPDKAKGRGERAEIRHLREFSRFLSPRVGFNEAEIWNAVAAVLGGMFPALLATIAAVMVVFYSWLGIAQRSGGPDKADECSVIAVGMTLIVLGLAWALFSFGNDKRIFEKAVETDRNWSHSYRGVILAGVAFVVAGVCMTTFHLTREKAVFGAVSICLHLLYESADYRDKRCERGNHELVWVLIYWLIALVTTGLGMWVLGLLIKWNDSRPIGAGVKGYFDLALTKGNLNLQWGVLSQPQALTDLYPFCILRWEPAITWLCMALGVSAAWLVIEGVTSLVEWWIRLRDPLWDARRTLRLRRTQLQEKLASRYLKWSCSAAALFLVWEFSVWTDKFLMEEAGRGGSIAASGGLTVIFAGLFAWLRKWLTKPDKDQVGGTAWEIIKRAFQGWIPAAVATAGALCLIVFTVLLMIHYGLKAKAGWTPEAKHLAIGAIVTFFFMLRFFDPSYISLHEFYRARIARAYLGAVFVEGPEWKRCEEEMEQWKQRIKDAVEVVGKELKIIDVLWKQWDQQWDRLQKSIEPPDAVVKEMELWKQRIKDAVGVVGKELKDIDDLWEERDSLQKSIEDPDAVVKNMELLKRRIKEAVGSVGEELNAIDVLWEEWDTLQKSIEASGGVVKKMKDVKVLRGKLNSLQLQIVEGLRNAYHIEKLRSRAKESRRVPCSRDNLFTSQRPEDDVCLTKLERPDVRPVHLICCAANHLSGDDLPNLYRGARSAVLSQRGITLGDDTVVPGNSDPPLMLSTAQTASAAAFNPQMGEKSFRLGRGSAFLMTALNLRLGLWVMNPVRIRADQEEELLKKGKQLKVPVPSGRLSLVWRIVREWLGVWLGRGFYTELIRGSRCLPEDRYSHLHLSDGGHFENLGLYELIRRHCTCIILSDAGQDETVAFDDLGNAIRRVREDFGVEIQIELDPLRPDEQRISRQYAVVGTIYYGGIDSDDKGTLIYIKPALTGHEPSDIQQYRTRNKKFPHESTGDQFFSEAQWESYRRLGEHIGDEVFAFIKKMGKNERAQAAKVFEKARFSFRRKRWHGPGSFGSPNR